MSAIDLNVEFRRALACMEESTAHCFITGKAGTGKSTLLNYFREHTRKKVVVLAPTGVAAVNIRGQTIHSFFGFKPDVTPEAAHQLALRVQKRGDTEIFRLLDTIVIDEISMVRADLFECIDRFLRVVRESPRQALGGVQLICIGDLYQLPPVVTTKDRALFTERYPGPYFFHAPIFADLELTMVELEQVYRQKDTQFIRLLNAVRNNSVTGAELAALNVRHDPHTDTDSHDVITLASTNAAAQLLNSTQLQRLRGKTYHFSGRANGGFETGALPTERELELKVGARVMLLNNDAAGRWVNGTIGTITAIDAAEPMVLVVLDDGDEVDVLPYRWEQFRYVVDPVARKLSTETTGTFTQLPLRLAWAITIHKSQGKTFDRVVIDLGRGTFATGQLYVALSRCRSLEGITLRQRLAPRHVLVDYRIVKFLTQYQYRRSDIAMPLNEKIQLINAAIAEQRILDIVYLKASDEKSRRVIRPRSMGKMYYEGRAFLGMQGFCEARQAERTFRVDRILELRVKE